ncbi:MAG: hypothetical protein ABI658_09875 [Acidimicrobiales bacterium]
MTTDERAKQRAACGELVAPAGHRTGDGQLFLGEQRGDVIRVDAARANRDAGRRNRPQGVRELCDHSIDSRVGCPGGIDGGGVLEGTDIRLTKVRPVTEVRLVDRHTGGRHYTSKALVYTVVW